MVKLELYNGEKVIFAVLYLQPLSHPYRVFFYKLCSFYINKLNKYTFGST